MMLKTRTENIDIYERASRVITLGTLIIALCAAVAAPVMAVTWSNRPFPGFSVEPTLVVNGNDGSGWTGRQLGVSYPQRVIRIAGVEVANGAQYNAVLASQSIGANVSVFTELPDGSQRLYPAVPLVRYPISDLVRLFWLPYFIGLAYMFVAIWMHRLRGMTRPGRAFVMFSLCTSLVCMLLFDGSSTHVGAGVWTTALAVIGGTLISLALRFPKEWTPVARRPWLLGLPYLLSIGLALRGLNALADTSAPWNYIAAWGLSYRYTGIGILMFLGMMLYRASAPGAPVVRQQARIVLVASILGFVPIVIWALAPLFGRNIPFNAVLFLPGLLIFPLGVALAIFRYRLLEAEIIVNRTIFYGLLTAVLAGIFGVMTSFTQQLFLRTTGRRSDTAIIITTLVIVSLVEPIKIRANTFVRTYFKEFRETTEEIKQFGEEVKSYLQMSDAEQLTAQLLKTAAAGLRAQSGAVSLFNGDRLKVVHTYGRWNGDAHIVLPLQADGVRYGMLALGPRQDQEAYTQSECRILEEAIGHVSQSIRLAALMRSLPVVIGEGRDDLPLATHLVGVPLIRKA